MMTMKLHDPDLLMWMPSGEFAFRYVVAGDHLILVRYVGAVVADVIKLPTVNGAPFKDTSIIDYYLDGEIGIR